MVDFGSVIVRMVDFGMNFSLTKLVDARYKQFSSSSEENSDHLVMREHAKVSVVQDGADKTELERIGTPDNWRDTRSDFSLIHKFRRIGFNVFRPDSRDVIEFRFSDPSDTTKERLVMMGLLFDGSYYDLIIFGAVGREVSRVCVILLYINPKFMFCRLTPNQRVKMVCGVVGGQSFRHCRDSGNC
jgi:hypothetical protein